MSKFNTMEPTALGDLAFESKVRAADVPGNGLRVYGVDRTDGLTPDAKYTSKELGRYKVLRPGMFAYNPMRLNIGSIAYCTDKHAVGLVSPDYVVFGCKSDALDPAFLGYAIKGPEWRQWTTAAGVGSVRVRIYFRELAKMPMTVPPLAEQKAIAAVLGALDDKIELNRRMNATLEAMARALFQSWFVDFDPVRAKLDGRKPAGLDAATATLFPAHFQDSPLGHIPQGWEVVRLDDIAHVMMGLSPDGESYNSEGVGMPLINGPVEFGDYFPLKTKWTEAATRFAAENDLIFCVRGSTTGRRVVSDGKYCIGRGVCSIRAKGGFYNFLYQTINIGLDRLLEKTTGSVFPSLSAPDIKGFSVIKPNEDVLEAYERITKPLIQCIQKNHHQSRTLATLRDTLLPKLMSGEICVSSEAKGNYTQ